ncbi:MAG: isochorismatase family protein [Hyphomonadaceae bacterium]|nr:isochorismatase family protein [Hyphomonadaceae bacterium]
MHPTKGLVVLALSMLCLARPATAETPRAEYVRPITSDNAAVLFIDNQTNLMLGVQSIDTTLLRINTEGLAQLAKIFSLPVVLTTTGGGANGPAGRLVPSITQAFPDVPVIDRTDYFNAMSDPRFARAVKDTKRTKIIIAGLTTDYCLVYPAATLIAQGYHVFIVTDASGSWTAQNDQTAMQRLIQMGATPINLQSLMGELQNSDAEKDLAASKRKFPLMLEWFSRYSPAPSILNMNMAPRGVERR